MVKGSSRRELSILWFIEYFGIVGILWREFVFDFPYSLGEGSGKHELLDFRVVFSHYPLKGGFVALLGVYLGGILRFIPFNYS